MDIVEFILAYSRECGLVPMSITSGWSVKLPIGGENRPIFQIQLEAPKQRGLVIQFRWMNSWVSELVLRQFRENLESIFSTNKEFFPSISLDNLGEEELARFCVTLNGFLDSVRD